MLINKVAFPVATEATIGDNLLVINPESYDRATLFKLLKMEKLNSKKFESFKDSKITKLSAIIGGAASKTVGPNGKDDYSYGRQDQAWTYKSEGDNENGFPPVVIPF